MKLGEAEQWLQQQLLSLYGAGESDAIAAWVFEKVCNLTRSERLAKKLQVLDAQQLHSITAIAQRLQEHEPVQYVLGESYFRNLKLYVDKSVLIPRPETEELVQWIIDDVKAPRASFINPPSTTASKGESFKILDVGSGSGSIALSLKNEIPEAEVWGCDASEAALNIARRNGAMLDVRVDFQAVDFLDESQWKTLPVTDVIVSNPPYIAQAEAHTMAPNVVQYEPHLALFVPDADPLIFYKALVLFGKNHLRNNGAMYVEIDEERGAAVVQLFQKAMYQNVELRNDMQGKNRMVKATWNSDTL